MPSATVVRGALTRNMMRRTAMYVGPTAIPGEMYDAGACPAAVNVDGRVRRNGKVQGELWQLPDDASALIAVLDRYEGCSPDADKPYRYIRTKRRIRLADGRRVTAWIYLWNLAIDRMPKIESGRWASKPDRVAQGKQRPVAEDGARGMASSAR